MKYDKSWVIVVIDGSDQHEVTVLASDERHAVVRALGYCEHHYGTSSWRVWSIDGTIILPRDASHEEAEGRPYRFEDRNFRYGLGS